MTQERLRLASLTVVGGPLDGHRCALDEVVAEVLIGSDPDCTLVIDMSAVSPIHARLWADLDACTVRDTHAPRGVFVNSTRVEGEARLKPRDLLWLGPPGEPESVCILPEFEAWVERIPAAVLASEDPSPDFAGTEEPEAGEAAQQQPTFEAQSFEPAYEPQALEPEGLQDPATVFAADAFEPQSFEPGFESTTLQPGQSATRMFEAEEAGAQTQVFRPQATDEASAGYAPQTFDPAVLDQLAEGGASSAAQDPFFVSEEAAVVDTGVSAPPPVDAAAPGAAAAEPRAPEGSIVLEGFTLADAAPAAPLDEDALALEAEPPVTQAEAPAAPVSFAMSPEPGAAQFDLAARVEDAPAALADDDMWAISDPGPAPAAFAAAPEAAEEPVDEFFLAEPEASESTELAPPAPAASAAQPVVASWPTPTAPPPPPTPLPRQVPLPPAIQAAPAPNAAAPAPAAAAPATAAATPAPRPVATPAHPPAHHAEAPLPVDVPESELPAAPSPRGATGRKPSARAGAQRPRGGGPKWLLPAVAGGGALLLVVAGLAAWLLLGGVRLDSISPQPVRAGQRATLTGRGFAKTPAGNVVTFEGQPARVLSATPTSLEVEVPPGAVETGTQRRMNVAVSRGSKSSKPLAVDVLQAPRLHGISPLAALPGEPVLIAGGGWPPGARVRFGSVEAQTVEIAPDRIRAIVPPMSVPIGTKAPVVVTVAGVDSNAAPFVIGHVPLITGLSPAQAAPGDVVQVTGVGFDMNPQANSLLVAGTPALVVSASGDTLKVVVPRLPAGDAQRAVELRVTGSTNAATATLTVPAPSDARELRFVAEPFGAMPGRPHAVLATRLGPAFVLAGSSGRSAAERALEAQGMLNGALSALAADAASSFEARNYEATPAIGLTGRPETLLEVSDEDAAAYNEDWTGLKGRGGPVTKARLARWWEAVGRDLLLITLRNERPRFAAALAAEGRVLGQVFDAARRTGKPGALWQLVEAPRFPQREALRLLALRVPASVAAPAGAAAAPLEPTAPPLPQLQLEGTYRGRENEDSQIRYVRVDFSRGGGTVTYEGGITFAVPLLSLSQPARDQVRYSLRMRGGLRYYFGRWDGETVSGNITTDAAGRDVVGTFELRR